MKKLQTLGFFFLLTLSGSAYSAPGYQMCGAKPNLLDKFLTDAEKIRIKCIEDVYAAQQEAIRKELQELHETSQKLSSEIKKVAIKSTYNTVQCAPRPGEPVRDPKLVSRCEELVVALNRIVDRMDELNGWSSKPKPKLTDDNTNIAATPPCPSKEKLEEMKPVRMFNRKLYQTYERCVTLAP